MLNRLYYNLKEPTVFSSAGPLQKASKQPAKKVQQFLESQPVYSRHKQVRYKFPRRQTRGDFIFSHVQADLIDLSALSRQNKGHRFCLSMIDCHSRFAFTIPLHRKTVYRILHLIMEKYGYDVRGVCTPQQVFDGKKKPAEMSPTPSKKPKFKIGEIVRMSHQNKAFRRGYKSGRNEVFHIVQALAGSPPTYRLVDKFGEEISGIVYEQEIVHAV
uniref:Integrase catalytic domain-containing protein n=1 Tax=Pristionchus pacificus TaxID=54126 RepID=A0A8R1UZ65_PRIPA